MLEFRRQTVHFDKLIIVVMNKFQLFLQMIHHKRLMSKLENESFF